MLRNLAERSRDGLSISLDWESTTDTVSLSVHDSNGQCEVTFAVKPALALDAYWHPFAYYDLTSPDYSVRVPEHSTYEGESDGA